MKDKWTYPIFQVVGYKNSGKTTVMKKLIYYFSKKGFQVGTLKHHGHGGEPDLIRSTDSFQHTKAGSIISAVQGESQLHVTVNETKELTFEEILHWYSFLPLDLLLIEGYKNEDYPKIVLLRDDEDIPLVSQLSNIRAIGAWDINNINYTDYFNFSINDIDSVLPCLAEIINLK